MLQQHCSTLIVCAVVLVLTVRPVAAQVQGGTQSRNSEEAPIVKNVMDQEPVVSQQNTATKPQTPLPASPKAEKIKKAVAKMGVGHKITAVLANGKEYHGVISGIAEENFQIAEVDLKGTLTVNYHETQKVHQNYFHKDPIFGRKYKTQVILLATIIPAIVVGFIYGFAHRGQ